MDVAVLQGARLVVVDLAVGEAQHLVVGDRADRGRAGARARGDDDARASSGLARARDRSRRRQVEGLDHEARDLARAAGAVVGGRGQDQLVLGPGHGHVEEPPLLVDVAVAAGQLFLHELGGQAQRVAPPSAAGTSARLQPTRKTTGNSRPLALCTVSTCTASSSRSASAIAGVVAGLAQEVEVGDEGGDAVVLGHVAVGLHGLEELRDVLDLGLGGGAALAGQARRAPPSAGGSRRAPRRCAAAAPPRRPRRDRRGGAPPPRAWRPPTPIRSSLSGSARSTSRSGRRLAARVLVEPQKIDLGHPVDLGRAEVEERDRVVGAREHAEERDEQPDLFARVEPTAAAEAMRDALDVQGAEEGLGVAVAAHQDGHVARTRALLDPLARRGRPRRRPRPRRCRRPGGAPATPPGRCARRRLSILATTSSR